MNDFNKEVKNRIKTNSKNDNLKKTGFNFFKKSFPEKYCYNFSWLGRPIIQYPQDIIAMQEIIWKVKPDLIIETGIAHGGSVIFSSSMLALLELADKNTSKKNKKLNYIKRKVVAIDIDIRKHNLKEIKKHPFYSNIQLIEGSSLDKKIIKKVKDITLKHKKIMVFLDSNHTHNHVLSELNAYAPFTSKNSYCVLFDTILENLPNNFFKNRPWKKGNNPMSALREFLLVNKNFVSDFDIDNKLLISSSPDGYLKRIG